MPRATKQLRSMIDLALSRAIIAASPHIASSVKRDLAIRWPGTYEWDAAGDWVDMLRDEFRRSARLQVVNDIPQPYKGTVVFEVVIEGHARTVAIGYSDFLPIDDECERNVDLYFKMQFAADGYASDKVVGGGYVCESRRLYLHLRHLRKLLDARKFERDVFGRFSLDYSPEIRREAHRILTGDDDLNYGGALEKVSYANFLREIATSKICIDLPGLGPLCFRLVNYLAVGACVIAYPHKALLHTPLIDREHIVYCKEDMSDLVELCQYYLQNDAERERIAANARQFFDENLHIRNLARYYLATIGDRLK